MRSPRLTIKQTPTGYWTVQRGSVELGERDDALGRRTRARAAAPPEREQRAPRRRRTAVKV